LLGLSALDPLNLVGTVLAGVKVPRQLGARMLYRDGIAVASLVAGQVELLVPLPAADEHAVRRALLREPDSSLAPSPADMTAQS
jgi:ATP-dependent Lhr-like helicase